MDATENARNDSDNTMMNNNGMNGSGMENGDHEKTPHHGTMMMASSSLSHSLPADDPANPINWPLYRKVLTSFQAWSMAATVALGLTCYTAGTAELVKDFNISANPPERVIAGFSLYLFGIAFAPIWTPHVTERYGRSVIYISATIIAALFNLGAGFSHSLAGVSVCRFFAGFFGGPTLVLLEGTFADIWSSETTNSYYAVQGLAAYIGAGLGALIGGYLVESSGNWRWTQWFPAALGGAVLLLGLGLPETYQREIPRRRGKAQGKTRAEIIAAQAPAQSGTTFAAMAKITVVQPFVLFLTQPIVTLTTIIMFFTFATTFQWFYAVPAALSPPPPMGPGYSPEQVGLAFLTAIVGSIVGAVCVITIDQVMAARTRKKSQTDEMAMFRSVELRLIPAIPGIMLMTTGLFWVGNTISPSIKPVVPIIGTAFFVWGSSMVTFSIIPYLFDSFAPAPTLAAITSQAVGRILAGGFLPLVILLDITALMPKWGLGLFGFISLAMWPIPIVLLAFGARWRQNSKYAIMN